VCKGNERERESGVSVCVSMVCVCVVCVWYVCGVYVCLMSKGCVHVCARESGKCVCEEWSV